MLFVLLFFTAAFGIYGAIAYDNSASTSGQAASFTYAHIVNSGSDQIMIFGIGLRNASGTVTGVSYSARTLTFVTRTAATNFTSEIWYMLNPPQGSASVTVRLNARVRAAMGSTMYAGVNGL